MTICLGIDQGTTGSTAILTEVTDSGIKVLAKGYQDFPLYYPQPSWVEQDLDLLWKSVLAAIDQALKKYSRKKKSFHASMIGAIGITNQRETLCFFDSAGQPARNAIVWQCKRSAAICARIKKAKGNVFSQTGLPMDPYFSASKLVWIKQEEPELYQKISSGQVLVGTVDTYLLYRLTGSYITEASNASRTQLYDLKANKFTPELLDFFDLDSFPLAYIKPSLKLEEETAGIDGVLPAGIPVTACLGDQQAALFGQGAFQKNEAKCTYGTGAFLLQNTGSEVVYSDQGLLSTVAWQDRNNELCYAVEGSSFICGAAVQFLRDQFGFIKKASESETKASEQWQAPGLFFLPFFSGLGSPYWNAHFRGTLLGMTRDTSQPQVIRAALEGLALSIYDLMRCFPAPFKELRVDGGACQNDLLMQIQADLSQTRIIRGAMVESTGLGACLASYYASQQNMRFSELKTMLKGKESVFEPRKNTASLQTIRDKWDLALSTLSPFYK